MKHLFLAVAMSLAMTACGVQSPLVQEMPPAPDASILPAYQWSLADAQNVDGKRIDTLFVQKDHPVRLDFTQTQVTVRNTCNVMSGAYTIEDETITVGPMRSTMKRCVDEKMNQLDQEIGKRLTGKSSFSVNFSAESTALPVLTLKLASGDQLVFSGQPTPETLYGSKGKTLFMEVSEVTRPCSHPLISEMQCLQIRQVYYDEKGIKTGNSGAFKNLYQPIEGYTHTPGVRNILRIKQYPILRPPADAPAVAYVLDMVVESETVTP